MGIVSDVSTKYFLQIWSGAQAVYYVWLDLDCKLEVFKTTSYAALSAVTEIIRRLSGYRAPGYTELK